MRFLMKSFAMVFPVGLIVSLIIFFPPSAIGQTYPDKPITIYCAFAPGATTDLTARALAAGMEKVLGVPVVVENKPGAGATVAPALVATKKPDGYTLCVTPENSLTIRPHLYKVAYDPLKDFTYLVWYSLYLGGLCVNSDSPLKTIDEFIAYAKEHPGLSYGSSGTYSAQHLATELLAQCKGLKFKHVPTKGGSEFYTLLLGRHTDFVAGSGAHIPYLKQGVFRMLLVYNTDRRDPNYPDIPTLKELGCRDVPPGYYMLLGPKGMPSAISKKLVETCKIVTEGPEFQKMLVNANLPYVFKDKEQVEKELPVHYEWFKNYFKEIGAKKEDKIAP